MIVHGKNVLLKVFKGGIENAIACNATCSISFETDTYETTFYDSGRYRTWIPNKTTITVDGSGPIRLGEPVTVADVVGWQMNRQIVEFNFTLTDGTDLMRVHGMGYFTYATITGDASQLANCEYRLIANGEVVFYSTNSNSNSDDDDYRDYEGEDGQTVIGDPDLLNVEVIYIAREGIGIKVITTGVPSGSEALFDKTNGTITFGTPLWNDGTKGEWVRVIFQR